MSDRREFVKKLGTMGAAAGMLSLTDPLELLEKNNDFEKIKAADPSATDEDFWQWVRQSYSLNWTLINLNNGGCSPQPKVVEDAFHAYNKLANQGPSYYMWRILDKGREALRRELADEWGCDEEELAICRNTTEALDTAIFGLDLKAGDEVVLNKYDYPNMKSAWLQRAKRDGIVLKWVDIDFPAEDDDAIVKLYTDKITNKTKVVHTTHMINWTGQIMPIRKIADAAKAKGLIVTCDCAHTFAHIRYKISDLNVDYAGTSLHKWTCAPYGTGMIYIKKANVQGLWPLLPDHDPERDDIRKFENLGTRSFPAEQAIAQALEFHRSIGIDRKEARLRYLKNYLYDQIKDIKGIKFSTSRKDEYSCALMLVGIEGREGADIVAALHKDHRIHTTPIVFEKLNGVRITPHVYTALKELDECADALRAINN